MRRLVAISISCLLLAGCATAGQPAAPAEPSARVSVQTGMSRLVGKVRLPEGIVATHAARIVSDNGGGVISNNASNIVSDNGGGLVGKTRYAVRQAGEVPLPKAVVVLLDAAGRPVKGRDGRPLTARTGPDGGYRFDAAPVGRNYVVAVALAGGLGTARAIAAKGRTPDQPVDVDLASSLTTGYVLATYVAGALDPQGTLDKLPRALEASARAEAAQALARAPAAAPDRLTDGSVVSAVERLERDDDAFAAQLEAVRRVFVTSGQVDQGAGRLALEMNIDNTHTLLHHPDGGLLWISDLNNRIWRLGADGRARTLIGRGRRDERIDGRPGPEAGLGDVSTFCVAPDGKVWVLESDRLSYLDAADVVHEVWPGFAHALAVRPRAGGGVWVLLGGGEPALWAVDPDGKKEKRHTWTGEVGAQLESTWQSAIGPDGQLWVAGHPDGKPFFAARLDPATGAHTPIPLGEPAPTGLALDPAGNLFLTDGQPVTRVRLRRPDGTESVVAEGGALHPGFGLDMDGALLEPDGSFILAPLNWWILRYSGGTSTRLVGTDAYTGGAADLVQWNNPVGVLPRPNGELLLADYSHAQIYVKRLDGTIELLIPGCFEGDPCGGDGPAKASSLGNFVDWAPGPNGAVYLADQRDLLPGMPARLRRLDPDGTISTVLDLPPSHQLEAVATTPAGEVWLVGKHVAADGVATRKVERWRPGEALPTAIADVPPSTLGEEISLAVAPNGTVWAANMGKVWRLAEGGGFTEVVADARVQGRALAIDAQGRVHVEGKRAVFRVDPATGALTPVAGEGTAVLGGDQVDNSLKEPYGMAFSASGDLHVADTWHNQFKVVPARLLP